MKLDTFMADVNYFQGQFRPFGQSGYMATHIPITQAIPGGLCRALACLFLTYHHDKDNNEPFWLKSDLFANQKLFSALGAKEQSMSGERAMFKTDESHKKLFGAVSEWHAKFQVSGSMEQVAWLQQVQNTLDLVSRVFLVAPLQVLGTSTSTKTSKHGTMAPLLATQPALYLHSQGGDHMTASVVRDGKYKFFDPNNGQAKFTDQKKFSAFVRTFYTRESDEAWTFTCGV